MTKKGIPNRTMHTGDTGVRRPQPKGRPIPIRIWPEVTNPETRCHWCTWVPKDGVETVKFINVMCHIHKVTEEGKT
jgi:hypothetical protein